MSNKVAACGRSRCPVNDPNYWAKRERELKNQLIIPFDLVTLVGRVAEVVEMEVAIVGDDVSLVASVEAHRHVPVRRRYFLPHRSIHSHSTERRADFEDGQRMIDHHFHLHHWDLIKCPILLLLLLLFHFGHFQHARFAGRKPSPLPSDILSTRAGLDVRQLRAVVVVAETVVDDSIVSVTFGQTNWAARR